ncbi:MAG: PD-(D/E)XK nuclease family protein, partial [Spirochaetes bacterium]|nr:PD-(D/E)XK nuclease family protein [Spirochaetota bacterium]
KGIEKNARIGYDVPESINQLLQDITVLRDHFHIQMEKNKRFTGGMKYLYALKSMDEVSLDEFKKIYFAGLFGMTGSEKEIVKKLWQKEQAEIIWEGSPDEWGILHSLVNDFKAQVEEVPVKQVGEPEIKIYSGFDVHSEILKTRRILKEIKEGITAVVLPQADSLFPLLTFGIDPLDENYNISLRYPLKRTSVYNLITHILRSQISRRKSLYSAKNYLGVISHPFIKNLSMEGTRDLIKHIESSLTGGIYESHSPLEGRSFISLEEIEKEKDIKDQFKNVLAKVHSHFFRNFENFENLFQLVEKLEIMLEFILDNTKIRSYILSGEIFKEIASCLERLKTTGISRQKIEDNNEANRIFLINFILESLQSDLSFRTQPLEKLEIIGYLETRNIRFDNVILLDVNEGSIPETESIDPLIPLGIYDQLGIPSPEHNEQIYHYYFERLIRSSRDTHLIFVESEDRPRSRYIEQIIWKKEKEKKELDVLKHERSLYAINLKPSESLPRINKSAEIMDFFSGHVFSASELDDYILCPVLFYYKQGLKFEAKKEISDDIEVTDRGLLIHHILQDTFRPFMNRKISPELFGLVHEEMKKALDNHFKNRIVTGEFYLFKEMALSKLTDFLKMDLENNFIIKHIEEEIQLDVDLGGIKLPCKGRIDRIDYYPDTGKYMIVDYKTGGGTQYSAAAVLRTDMGNKEEIHKNIKTFQLPLYLYLFHKKFSIPMGDIDAKLIWLQKNEEEYLFNKEKERDILFQKYLQGVRTILKDIFSLSQPFQPFDEEFCQKCEFNSLCYL